MWTAVLLMLTFGFTYLVTNREREKNIRDSSWHKAYCSPFFIAYFLSPGKDAAGLMGSDKQEYYIAKKPVIIFSTAFVI